MGALAIALAIPVFFVLILIEWAASRALQKRVYRFFDAISALSCGIGSQVVGLFFFGVLNALYALVWDRFALFDVPETLWTYIAVGIVVDFLYYWWHRAGHRVNAIWSAHIVHHHSQDYNLAVALRQAWLTRVSSFFFYLPLAVIGVPLKVFVVSVLINTLYQFWIHTRLVGKLGPLEWVLNTPSHHRVHHGINPAYIDKNYAGILIIWDRFFGTFEEEREEVVYGTVQPLQTGDPIAANFHYFAEMEQLFRRAKGLAQKVFVLVAPPEWDPEGIKTVPPVDAATYARWAPETPRYATAYVMAHFVIVLVALVPLLAFKAQLSKPEVIVAGILILWATRSWTGLLEEMPQRPRYVLRSEALRLLMTPLWFWSVSAGWPLHVEVTAALILVSVFSAAALVGIGRHAGRRVAV